MGRPTSLKIDPTQSVSIEVAGFTPHVFRYKMWLKLAGTTKWEFAGKGTTGASVPDRLTLPVVTPSTRLQCWLGIAAAQSLPCRAEFRVEQGGTLVPGGKWDESDPMTGKTATAIPWILELV